MLARPRTRTAPRRSGSELTGWVAWIRTATPSPASIPGCWAEHPELVEELTALWLAWQAAYQDPTPRSPPQPTGTTAGSPGVLYRLEHGPFALDCNAGHHPRPEGIYAPPSEKAPSDQQPQAAPA